MFPYLSESPGRSEFPSFGIRLAKFNLYLGAYSVILPYLSAYCQIAKSPHVVPSLLKFFLILQNLSKSCQNLPKSCRAFPSLVVSSEISQYHAMFFQMAAGLSESSGNSEVPKFWHFGTTGRFRKTWKHRAMQSEIWKIPTPRGDAGTKQPPRGHPLGQGGIPTWPSSAGWWNPRGFGKKGHLLTRRGALWRIPTPRADASIRESPFWSSSWEMGDPRMVIFADVWVFWNFGIPGKSGQVEVGNSVAVFWA